MVAFINNSGDIIIDATLTDVGRQRLAKGDGSFEITKFALGDDEINYNLFNTKAGTAYADLNILKTPVLEAITDNLTGLRNKLMTMAQEDLLYLPTLKLATLSSPYQGKPLATGINKDMFVILSTDNAYNAYSALPQGFLDGRTAAAAAKDTQSIWLHQGLDTTEISFTSEIDASLDEGQLIFQMDDRFCKLVQPGAGDMTASSVDEDNIASYYDAGNLISGAPEASAEASVIAGPRGGIISFGVRVSDQLFNSEFLFNKFGRTMTSFFTNTNGSKSPPGLTNAKVIDTVIRITGVTTGMSLDIPFRIVREA